MRDSAPSARYSSVCNVLRQRRIWLIPTYSIDIMLISMLIESTDTMIYIIYRTYGLLVAGGLPCKCATRKRKESEVTHCRHNREETK